MKVNNIFSTILVISVTLVSCKKDPTPGKIRRISTKGEWKISQMTYDKGDSTLNFKDYTFKFTELGKVIIEGGEKPYVGSWEASGEKEVLYSLKTKSFLPFKMINADWKFDVCEKDKMELSYQKDTVVDKLVFGQK